MVDALDRMLSAFSLPDAENVEKSLGPVGPVGPGRRNPHETGTSEGSGVAPLTKSQVGPVGPGSADPGQVAPLAPLGSEQVGPGSADATSLNDWDNSVVAPVAPLAPAENHQFPHPGANDEVLPFRPADLEPLDALDFIGRLELRYGGRIALTSDGPRWCKRQAEPPAEVMAMMRMRRAALIACLEESASASRERRRITSDWGSTDWLAFFDERAGIIEHDGQQPRAEAERLALGETVDMWLRLNCPPAGEPENGCWQCGGFGHAEADPLINRICRGGVFWLHPRCWAEYDAAAQVQAEIALRAIIGAAS